MKKLFIFLLIVNLQSVLFAQVNVQTGSATFSLPMFSWQDTKSRLNSAVAINYSSGNGLKVNDIASNVGQGWNLLAGGVINRMQVGEPDDQVFFDGKGDKSDEDISRYPWGILYADIPAFKGCPRALTRYPIYGWKNQVYAQRNAIAEDKQLDYFSFQFNGKTGLFVLDPTNLGVAKSLGDTKMKITFQQDANLKEQGGIRTKITSFSIQDEDGLIYKFTVHGKTKVLQSNYCDKNLGQLWRQPKFENNNVFQQAGFDNGEFSYPWVINSWYLSEIEDPLTLNPDQVTHRKITFNYDVLSLSNAAGEDISYNTDKNYSIISHKTSVTKSPEISSITFPDGHYVKFNYDIARLDLIGESALTSVDITYKTRYLSKYQLNTTYIIQNRYGTPVSDYQKSVARLYLKSVRKIGVDLKEDTPPYIFDYYLSSTTISPTSDDFVPPPFFYAKDIWGFYNGNNSVGFSNETIPLHTNISELSNNQLRGLCFRHDGVSGVYLNSKSGYAKNGLLRQIIYPTSGTLTYQYEQNSGVLNGATTTVGGVHVSQTSSTDGGYSNGCNNPITTQYNYVMNGTGSASSLWGIEMPVNSVTTSNHYQPEWKSYHVTLGSAPFGECFWHYRFPGIASQQQAISMPWLVQSLNDISPYLGALSIVTTVMDIATYVGGGSPVSLIIDIIGGLVTIGLTCIGNQSRDNQIEICYNSDLNGIAPLPTQFKRVEIVENMGTIGKTVQEFTSSDDYPIWEPTNPVFSAKQRFAPWAYGLPKLTTVFNFDGDPVKQIEYVYDTSKAKKIVNICGPHPACDPNNLTGINSTLISCKCEVIKSSSQRNTDWSSEPNYINDFQTSSDDDMKVEFYAMYTGRIELLTTKERVFKQTDPSKFLETTTEYTYNSGYNYQVNSITTTQSNNAKNIRNIKYSSDYASSQNVALSTLFQNNILNIPVSIINKVYNPTGSGGEFALSEKVTEFSILSTGDIQPVRILEQRFTQPSASVAQYWPDNDNSSYKTIQSFTYDALGNLIGQKDEGNRIVTNIYDDDSKYVVANVINADALTDKCSYTSFESAGFGGWSLTGSIPPDLFSAVTGTKAFTLNGKSFTRSSLNTAKSYILSFWANNSGVLVNGGATQVKSAPSINGYTYYEYSIAAGTSSVTVSGNANIDELRLYPALGRMKTITYDPLIGKTSECDENNRITYYDYDNLGRVQYIRDENRNIFKMYEYNTISDAKQNGCPTTYKNHFISEVFTRSCGAGYVGTKVPFTVDADTYSSSISQADADAQAENYILTYGQANANSAGSCQQLFYNTTQSQSFVRESCPVGKTAGPVTYTVPANTYSSTIDIQDANQMALADIAANGEAFANSSANSICTVDYNPTWLWQEGAASYCSPVNGTQHLFVQETNINPNSSTYNQTRWYDMGPQDACPPVACSITGYPGIFMVDNGISNDGNTVSFYIVFASGSGTTNWSTFNQIATINGDCKPTSTRLLTMSESGRTWEVVITSSGALSVKLISGTPPSGTDYIALTGGTYNINNF